MNFYSASWLPQTRFSLVRPREANFSLLAIDWAKNVAVELKKVPKDELRQQGTVILLASFDHDTFGASDFAGLCVIQGSSVPTVEEAERKTEHLNFFHFKESRAFLWTHISQWSICSHFLQIHATISASVPECCSIYECCFFSVLKTDLENLISWYHT